MGETIMFHARMAAYLCAPTEFRLLNPPCTLGGDSLQVRDSVREWCVVCSDTDAASIIFRNGKCVEELRRHVR